MEGKKISAIDELEDGKEYVCAGKGETFKKLEYNKIVETKRLSKRLSNCKFTPQPKVAPPDCVRPRIVTIIRNGIKPRKVSVSFFCVNRKGRLLLLVLWAAAKLSAHYSVNNAYKNTTHKEQINIYI